VIPMRIIASIGRRQIMNKQKEELIIKFTQALFEYFNVLDEFLKVPLGSVMEFSLIVEKNKDGDISMSSPSLFLIKDNKCPE
jgi:hypothetical protein